MTGMPHPNAMAIAAAQGHADLMAHVYRERLADQLETREHRGQRWAGQVAVMVTALALALLLVAYGAMA